MTFAASRITAPSESFASIKDSGLSAGFSAALVVAARTGTDARLPLHVGPLARAVDELCSDAGVQRLLAEVARASTQAIGLNRPDGKAQGSSARARLLWTEVTAQEAFLLGTREIRGKKLAVVNLGHPEGEQYFKAYYDGVLSRCFHGNELVPEEILHSQLYDQRAASYDPKFRLIGMMRGNKVVGAVHSRLVNSRTGEETGGFIEYRLCAPDWRRQGIGRALYQEAWNYFETLDPNFLGTFGEFNDPWVMSHAQRASDANHSMNPEDRLLHHASLGYRLLDAPYAQPSLGEGSEPVWTMMMGFRPCDPNMTEMSVRTYLGLLNGYHGVWMDPETDPTSRKIREMLRGVETIPLVDLMRERTFVRAQRDLAAGET